MNEAIALIVTVALLLALVAKLDWKNWQVKE